MDAAHVDAAGNFVAERGPAGIVDGKLFGRGSVDAKGPLAAFLAATARLDSSINARVVIVGAVEGEAPHSKGRTSR